MTSRRKQRLDAQLEALKTRKPDLLNCDDLIQRYRGAPEPSDLKSPGDRTPSDRKTPGDPESPVPVTESPGDRESPEGAGLTVKDVAGFLKLPNAVLDSLLPQLNILEQVVYLRLFRLSHGFRSDTCRVSFGALAKSCNVTRRGLIRAVDRLEALKLVERVERHGGLDTKGNVYRVWNPAPSDYGSPGEGKTPGDRRSSGERGAPFKKEETKTQRKEKPHAVASSEESDKDPRAEYRLMAARLVERHKGTHYKISTLRVDMTNVLDAQGASVDDEVMEWILDPYRAALAGDW